ncbi:MAG TPA: fused MFS/spermidine synthase [Bacteroidales bacterium]|nr:fused MFS/spermidine synthase [Bacteroidales bacterium]
MKKLVLLAILVVGFSGIVVQILLLREFLIVFAGTELVIAIILANWLILEALGAFLAGRWIDRFPNTIKVFTGLNLIFSLMLPAAVYATRLLKDIWGVLPGEGLGLMPVFVSSLVLFAPISFLHGALFTVSCKLNAGNSHTTEKASPIGNAYIFETLGTIAGAVIFTYILIPFFHSIHISLFVALINLLCGLLLIWQSPKSKVRAKWHFIATLAALIVSGILLTGPGADNIQRQSIDKQWRGQTVVHYQNSLYGNITVVRSNGQYTFFSDGVPHITLPDPNLVFIEEFVHLPMLSHPNPQSMLVLGGGAGGKIYEILKHPVERVVYTELDPTLLTIVKKFPTPIAEFEFGDPRVTIEYLDGRTHMNRTTEQFDMILVGASNPVNLRTNRFFTTEFFETAKRRLQKNGILVLSLPGSLTYLSRELQNINASVYISLSSVFDHVRVIPGDVNLYLASMANLQHLVTPENLSAELQERNIQAELINPFYIDFKLDPRWTDWFFTSLEGANNLPNRDFSPRTMYYSIAHWNELFSPGAAGLFAWIEHITLKHLAIPIGLIALTFLLFSIKNRPGTGRATVTFAIATSGFAGMIFELSLIYTFQTIHGYIFHHLGLLVAAFMTGVAIGGKVITRVLHKIQNSHKVIIILEASMLMLAIMIPLTFLEITPAIHHHAGSIFMYLVFFLLSLLAGFLLGAQFPLASKMVISEDSGVSKTAGTLFGADLLGGWVGGLLGGVALLPLLGLFQTGLVIVLLKLSSLLLLLYFRVRKNPVLRV